jgi:ParB/RepB/Spo0J family partition protein
MSEKNILDVELGNVVPSPTNPRKDYPEETLKELAASIKEQGVVQPIIVVKHDGEFVYEIVAGERRWRASKIAGRKNIPCIVKELTKEQIIEIQWIENLQREDVSALDEGLGLKKLMEQGWTVDKLCDRFKKKRSTIFNRLKLARLEGPAREALKAGKIDATVAGLVATLPVVWQGEALEKILKGKFGGGVPMSFREAKEHIQFTYDADLEDVPWDLKDKKLLKSAGCCEKCPKRSGNLSEEEQQAYEGPNVCTDLDCKLQKLTAWRAQALEAEAAKGGRVATLAECDRAFEKGIYSPDEKKYLDPNHTFRWNSDNWDTVASRIKNPKTKLMGLVDRDGKIRKYYLREEILAELAEHGVELWDPKKHLKDKGPVHAPAPKGETKEEKAARLEKERLAEEKYQKQQQAAKEKQERDRKMKKRVQVTTLARILDQLTGGKEDVVVWKLMVLANGMDGIPDEMLAMFELKPKDQSFRELPKRSEKWKLEQWRKYAIAGALCMDGYDDDIYSQQLMAKTCKEAGLDLKKIEKAVMKDLEAAEREAVLSGKSKPAAAKAPKKKGKK